MKRYHLYSSYHLKKRLTALVIAVTFLFLCLICRLFVVQVIQGKDLQLRAAEQWARDLPITAGRGHIVDRNGELLAANNTVYNIYVRPREVADAQILSSALSGVLGIPYKDIYLKIGGANVSEVTVCKKASKEQADKIISLDFKGVYLSMDIDRIYPNGELLSQTLGFISADNVGQAGLEKYYDKYLKGLEGRILTESDLTGRRLESGQQYYIPPVDGLCVKLTVDAKIQAIAENVMSQAMLSHKPVAARALVLDPQTGEILAMVNKPSLDLNNLPRDDLQRLNRDSRNSLVIDIYEPGSTFKIFTVSANIEEYLKGNKNAFSPEHIFYSGGTRIVDGRKIKCWTSHAGGKHSNLNLTGALDHSCNPIFVDVALSLGKETFYKYISAFNFGNVTGIDYPGEGTGMVVPQSYCKNGDLARIGFGQSIAVSPLQLAAATAAAVNGGRYYQPYLVSEIYSMQGVTAQKNYPVMTNAPISEKASKTVAGMLESVVENGGGKNAYIKGYRVAGKTGTAQKFENGKIAQGKYVSSFVGFFPANNPQYLCLVIVDEPQGAHYGSVVAAPYAKLIFEQIIHYKEIKPFK